jgi:hypothetical protein
VIVCTLLTFAACADPRVQAAIAFGQMTVPIVWTYADTQTCMGLGTTVPPADAQLETEIPMNGSAVAGGTYSGRIVLKLRSAKIELTAFTWPKMSAAEQAQLRNINRAALWHELGHLVTAQASIDAENARPDNAISALSRAAFVAQMQSRTDAALARFTADQSRYDDLTEHGIRQHQAPPPLAGTDTVAQCDAR